ncbi:MAG: UDP-N-acetylglucosamine 1-carboxyvinyltransferase, partial [Clostridia bacterium]|nr:UDP-N-acetylglucosamine 1-carboxyvinyltransferase [Clostridia bacterium]
MSKLIIEGARRLKGEVNIQGAKNSILPILAASLATGDECIIHNCPEISDVRTTLKILEHLGCKVKFEKNTVTVNSEDVKKNNIPNLLMREMRSSIIFLGALISSVGSAEISLPGGCELGPRPIDMHIEGLRQLGLRINEGYGVLKCGNDGGLDGCNIALSFPSVGATENLIIASVKARGTTVLSNTAREPEIMDLIAFLNSCGAKIESPGEGTLIIEGVKKLHGTEYTVIPDRIAAVTYMSAAAVTVGDLLLKNVIKEHIGSVIPVFEEAGCTVQTDGENSLRIIAPTRPYFNRMIRTMPYPGFPTDAQAPVMAMSCLADGTSVFVENIFTNRYKHVGELLRLGADIKVEGRVAIVEGVKRLLGTEVTAMDLRGAAALVVAGLGAEGRTKISGLSHIDRGYENLENNLES